MRSRFLAMTLLAAAIACGDGSSSSADSPVGRAAGAEGGDGVGVTTRANPVHIELGGAGGASAHGAASCPADGLWHPCSVAERLEQSGLVPRRVERDSGVVREDGLTIPGTAFSVGRGELVLFYYPDRASREREQARLDATRFVRWPQDPARRGDRTLIASENLLALLESSSSSQRERINNALTAGPPQPAP